MKIALIVHAAVFEPERVTTGNEMRAEHFRSVLDTAGHEVTVFHPASLLPPDWQDSHTRQRFSGAAHLQRRLEELKPDAAIVGYWELLQLLPGLWPVPVALDFLAPRPLEVLLEDRDRARREFPDLIHALRRADHFLVGNARQHDLLLGWLLLAGIDCADSIPVSIIPNGQTPNDQPHGPPESECVFIHGGVDWPWRQDADWLDRLHKSIKESTAPRRGRLTSLTGDYKYHAATPDTAGEDPLQMLSYNQWQGLLRERAHIGIELSRPNIERHFAQSFRLADFLAAGLPVLISAEAPMAAEIQRRNAGWVIETPADLEQSVPAILSLSPEDYQRMSQAALTLARDRLAPQTAFSPLLKWLEQATKTTPGERWLDKPVSASDQPPPVVHGLLGSLAGGLRNRIIRSLIGWLNKTRRSRPGRAAIIVTRSDLYPPNHGAAVKIDRTAWGLSFQFDDVLIVTDDRRHYYRYRRGELERHRFPWWLRPVGLPRVLARWRLARRGLPPNECLLYLPMVDRSGFLMRILYLARRYTVDWYQAEFPAYARPALNAQYLLGGTSVLVEHNIEYQRIAEQYPDTPPAVLGWLKHLELHWARLADRVITVSDADRARLVEEGIAPDKVHTIPHGVDLDAFHNSPIENVRARLDWPDNEPILVYHGTFDYAPNLEAMQVMARQILPRLDAAGQPVRVLAVGRSPPKTNLHPRIHFTGPVESVATWLKAADLAVVPLQQGGGTRMKILDYFAAGLPVVSTPKGIEGIPVRHDEQALIEEDFDAFAQAVIDLLKDPDRASRLARAGRDFVATQDWRQITARYVDLFTTAY